MGVPPPSSISNDGIFHELKHPANLGIPFMESHMPHGAGILPTSVLQITSNVGKYTIHGAYGF